MWVGKRFEQDGVNHREDRGIGADADCNDEDGNGVKPGTFARDRSANRKSRQVLSSQGRD